MTKETILKETFGYDYFKEGQEELISNILDNKDVVGIMPTGAGKSACFQIPSLMFNGITLVISPLISLMKDQVNALTQAGIKAAYLNSSLTTGQLQKTISNAKNYVYKIIYVAPERLNDWEFLRFIDSVNISMLTIDEAHCISHWGQDFRPSYLKIVDFINYLPVRPVISAFTATATDIVREDIIVALKLNDPFVLVTGFDRKNLYFEVSKPKNKTNALMAFLKDKKNETGIIYCSTRKEVEKVCDYLNDEGIITRRYHAGLSDSERKSAQEDFIYDTCQIIVATNAFGMGIDKSNVTFVVHYNMPKDLESYYQEAGRAGRDGQPAVCTLFYSDKDVNTNLFLIENGSDKTYSDRQTELKVLENNRTKLRKMTQYCHLTECLREYILSYFGETKQVSCDNCSVCNTNFEVVDITQDTQKILSCIIRGKERYGIVTIIDILRGAQNKKLLQLKLNELTTFGIMKTISKERIRYIINYLIAKQYIFITNDQYPIVKIGINGKLGLQGTEKLEMKITQTTEVDFVEADKKSYTKKYQVNNELMKKLKVVRSIFAKEQRVPAFVIFHDTSLIDMCMKLPKNQDEFLNIQGVGNVKLKKYGHKFIAAINDFTKSENTPDKILFDDLQHCTIDEIDFISLVELSEKLVNSNIIAERINCVLMQKSNIKISTHDVTKWLIEQNYLMAEIVEGKSQTSPTEKGQELGIQTSEVISAKGFTYITNVYDISTQKYIIDNIKRILTFNEKI